MIRLIRPLTRHPGVSRREFAARHRQYMDFLTARPDFQRVVAGYAAANAIRTYAFGLMPRQYDGIQDFWFDDWDAAQQLLDNDALWSLAAPLEQSFVGGLGRRFMVCREQPVAMGRGYPERLLPGKVRLTRFLVRRNGQPAEAFLSHHLDRHLPLYQAAPAVKRNALRLTVAHRSEREPQDTRTVDRYDALTDIWFDGRLALYGTLLDPTYRSTVRADEAQFLDARSGDQLVSSEFIRRTN